MKLPDLISALERNEYAEVLRGTKYCGKPGTARGDRAWFNVQEDAEANAATVTVLREAVRELTKALERIATHQPKMTDTHALGYIQEIAASALALTAPLVNEKEG